VTLRPRRLWSLRLSLGSTRWVLYAVAVVGVVATVRNAVDPPFHRVVTVDTRPLSDASSAWFALSFVRAYLTWTGNPAAQQQALASFIAPTVDPAVGLTIAQRAAEPVEWIAVAAEQEGADGDRDYTVAASTRAGLRYIVVAVGRGADGRPFLAHYPALVGPPAVDAASALDGASLPAVTNGAVEAVLDRALSNYLGDSSQNLAADLAPGARVDPVASGLVPRGIERLAAEPSGSVLATVRAADPSGDVFTLAYEVSLVELHGRWEITRIEP
jgi:hypothetical protein